MESESLNSYQFPSLTIAKVDRRINPHPDHVLDEKLRGRLDVNLFGSLIITNLKTEDSGLYDVIITNSKHIIQKRFSLTVTEAPGKILPGAANWPMKMQHFVSKWKRKVQNKTSASLSVEDTKGGHVTPSESEIKEGDEGEQTSEDKTTQQMNPETGDLTITDIKETVEGVCTPPLINTDGKITDYRIINVEATDSAGVRDDAVAVTMPLLDKAADRFSTSSLYGRPRLQQGSHT